MSTYFWYQKAGGEDAWVEALSEHRAKIVAEINPAFMTVLDAHSAPDSDWGKEEYAKMRYSGPLYFDWDGEEIALTIPPFIEFLMKLEGMGVNLKAIRLFATGGRGFHCEIPEATFMGKVPRAGTTLLPYIYRDMALELATETMDLRIYTGRKGRMWRTPGVVRKNGKYKVQITADQALSMTPELYDELCAAPVAAMQLEPATLSVELATLFAKASNRVDALGKAKAKAKTDNQTLTRFNGDFPTTVKRIMAGEGIAQNKGFHQIAMQLAITANALGKTSDELVAEADGLCKNHSSDSPRYNSPRKRKEELRRMWEYTHDNDLYDFSVGGIRSLCAPGVLTQDLDDPSSSAAGTVQDVDGELSKELEEQTAGSQGALSEGIVITKKGIFKRTDEGYKPLSNLGLADPKTLVDLNDGTTVGVEATVYADEKPKGRQLITQQMFMTRSKLNEFCIGRSAVFSGTDTQASVVQLLLTRKSQSSLKGSVYITRREGIDLVQNPTEGSKVDKEVLWVSAKHGVFGDTNVEYRFQPREGNNESYNSDLASAQILADTPESRQFMDNLLDINETHVVSHVLGWFVSCFHKQHYTAKHEQFPLLHPNGPAGSGKSMTCLRLLRMFWNVEHVKSWSAAKGTSDYIFRNAWTGSSSIPMFIDEFKPAEMDPRRYAFLMQNFRLIYNQGGGGVGGVNNGAAGSSYKDVTHFSYSAPVIFAAESQEMQTAIVQRTIAVAFSPAATIRHKPQYKSVVANIHFMTQLGKLLMLRTVGSEEYNFPVQTMDMRNAALDPLIDMVEQDVLAAGRAKPDERVIYNRAVVIAGLHFLKESLQCVFGCAFDGRCDELITSVREYRDDASEVAMTEYNKVINDMALISRTEDPDSEFALREGYEYVVGEGYIDLLVKECFVKYFAWNKRKGLQALYMNPAAFLTSVTRSAALISRNPIDSKLDSSSGTKAFRFSLEKLKADGVESFKSKSLA